MKSILPYLSTCLLLVGIGEAYAQSNPSIESLREEIRKAEAEIEINTRLLEKTQKDRQLSQSELKLIQSRIRSRRDVVNSLQKQIGLIERDINSKNREIAGLRKEVESHKKEYADMVKAAYKNYRLNNFLLFLFASDDFNDATRRMNFMKRYNRMRLKKAEDINRFSDSLTGKIRELDKQLSELDNTKKSQSAEIASLGKDESQYQKTLTELQKEQNKISQKLKAQRDQIDKAQRRIQEIIAAEARKNQEEKLSAAEEQYLTELSGRFDENKGKLPYPLRGGVIIDRYGTHKHPTQPNLIINNKGINIAGEPGSEVTCVFEGTVSRIFSVPMYKNCVMVRHGEYITLYANLATVSVKTGEKVSLNQRIGRIANTRDDDDNFLHFEVWQQTTNLNPEQWLRR